MKKKTVFGSSIILVLVLLILPFKQQKQIRVQAQYLLVFQQLVNPGNWKNWQPDLQKASKSENPVFKIIKNQKTFALLAPGIAIDVDHSQGFAFAVDENIHGKNSSYVCIPIPGPQNGITLITVIKRKNIFQLLYGFLSRKTFGPDMTALKNYMENARLFYGFDIKKTTVVDSNVVVIKKRIAARNKTTEIRKIQQDLKDFIRQHQLKVVQPIIADIRKIGSDSLRMMIGMPVNKQVPSEGNVVFMHLPTHGRMLTGRYDGKYGRREKLYNAMRNYMSDHNLTAPEDPYEKYLDNKIPANDSNFVRLQVNFPIY